MEYPRMKYPYDQREWIRFADAELPALKEQASILQVSAAGLFAEWSAADDETKMRYAFMMNTASQEYELARQLLWRVIFYEGMRRANLPE